MRLDKFLKVSRVIKRRALAKEVCDRGQVTVNGRAAKAGTEIKLDDTLVISFGNRTLKIKILSVKENVPAKMAAGLYEVLEDDRTFRDENELL
ncbi:MAG: RNA-binding S4 domain-containing protein [Desulfotomaculaceae bacterium]|nr:RNA-binding S4 domain-containing protein [Desulfotomaculaceae bacterium]